MHNRYVVDSLRKRLAPFFIEQISEVPDGAILIFSAPTACRERYATKRRGAT
ncbi:hypothetical protein MJ390_04860 [Klebsiella pneumoniae]|nr:hypothetical protein MJ390_04860 [Klebsiella pneumoniae]